MRYLILGGCDAVLVHARGVRLYGAFVQCNSDADVALPIINLRQQEDWSPRVVDHQGKRIWTGYFVRMWEWFATVVGWVLSLMFVSAVGGFIRR